MKVREVSLYRGEQLYCGQQYAVAPIKRIEIGCHERIQGPKMLEVKPQFEHTIWLCGKCDSLQRLEAMIEGK